jgi:TonB-linked SusC/RagA family outer membrane protein
MGGTHETILLTHLSMKKRYQIIGLLVFFLASVTLVMAQERTVSGSVKDGAGATMPGVNVIVKGTSVGTTTDGSGQYTIALPSGSTVLVFSFIGYQSQEVDVGSRTSVDVAMAEDVTQLGEVVVTALGVERSTKALQYSVTEVKGDKFTEARENNLGNALVGRIAGVNVTKPSTGPAGSTRIVIRGNKSLNGSNQPMYVIDGIPMDNGGFGQAGLWGGRDEGDGLTSINPDDIESITVLKGANASALYGSRGGNGVINITTKRGSKKKGIGIEFNSNYVVDKLYDQSELQTKYGAGNYVDATADGLVNGVAQKPIDAIQAFNWGNIAWGPAMDGSSVPHFDGVSRPYSYAGNNFEKFFETGNTWTNSLSMSGGGDNQTFRFSISDLRSESIVPNSGFDRTNLAFNVNSKFGQKLTLNAKVMYSHEEAKNRPQLSDSPNNAIHSLWRTPPSIDVTTYFGEASKPGAIPSYITDPALLLAYGQGGAAKFPGQEWLRAPNNWDQNPYWATYVVQDNDIRDRFISSAQLRYDILDWLYVSGRIGMDWYTRRDSGLGPEGTGHNLAGSRTEGEDRVREINMDWMLGANKTFGDFTVNAFVGGNKMTRSNERISANGNGFSVQFFDAINNAATRNFGYSFNEMGINSLFASAEVSYKNYLFLTATTRTDWFSVLNPEYNKVSYPSVGASWVFSETFTSLPSVISFGKLRASWAQSGIVTINPYDANLTYSLNGNTHLGYKMAAFSSAGGNNGTIPNPAMQPALSTELEFGFDVRFFDGRLGFDFTYYDQTTTDDIVRATISRASGFQSTFINVGQISNNGVEILLSGTPLRGPLTWDVSLNFAKNNNNVDFINDGQDEIVAEEPRTRNVFIKHIVGQPFGTITGRVQQTTPDGTPIFNADGTPLASTTYVPIGNGVPDFTGGVNNTFSYKGITLDFLIDFMSGGDIFSGSNNRLAQWGMSEQSLIGRAGETPLHINGVVNTGTAESPVYTPVDRDLTPHEANVYWNRVGGESTAISTMYMYDASFVKLRQLTLGYTLPRAWFNNTPIQALSLSLVGRNLWVISKNIDNVDPESTYSSNAGAQGLEYFAMPVTRSYGFNLRVSF